MDEETKKIIEDMINLANQLKDKGELLCRKYDKLCGYCPFYKLNDCSDFYELACVEYDEESNTFN